MQLYEDYRQHSENNIHLRALYLYIIIAALEDMKFAVT
jgi:hypothetical protein